MITVRTYEKDPHAVLDWRWDWLPWLQPGETIATSTMTASSGLVVASSSNTLTNATAWLTGGTAGQEYTVTNQIVTNQGRTDDRSITVLVVTR